jgi:hypothetical protein
MLDRAVVEEFLSGALDDAGIVIPSDIPIPALAEAFSRYAENDYYDWLKDNFKSFFNHYNPDWDQIRGRLVDVSG